MNFLKSLILSLSLLFVGCGSTGSGAFVGSAYSSNKKHLEPLEDGAYRTPCINLPFIDKNFPQLLGDVIRLHDPKVDPVGAYKISRLILKNERKEKKYVIDTKSVKLCRLSDEMGYSFKAVNVTRK